ncbi:arginase family protein [Nakamurella sp. GG22]
MERQALLTQLKSARQLIEAHQPDHVVVFGGDCLVEQAPVSYMNEKHQGRLGMLWIDAHPDIATPEQFPHAHTMVLGNLLGEGDPEFAKEVAVPLQPANVMFAGLQATTEHETAMIQRLGLRKAGPGELATTSQPVLDWIRQREITHLAVHLDLDVLDPTLFRSLLFANPMPDPDTFMDYPQGAMTFDQVSRLVNDVASATEVVSMGIAEHMPWEAINLQRMLRTFPVL